MRARWFLLISLLWLTLAGCGGSSQVEVEHSPAFTPTDIRPLENLTQTPLPSLTDEPVNTEAAQMDNFLDDLGLTPLPSDSDPFVNLAKQDLADRLKINVDQIISLKVTEITWPDITQGCSSATSQTLSKGRVSGYRIWLQANGENFAYHVGLDGQVYMCPK